MLSKRLKLKRNQRKLTQEQLAKKVNTTKGTISNYENGYSTPSNDMLIDLATALHTTADYLLGIDPYPAPSVLKNPVSAEFIQENLPIIRNVINITIKDLAKKMNLPPENIMKWEAGRSVPTPEQIDKLNDIFSDLSSIYEHALNKEYLHEIFESDNNNKQDIDIFTKNKNSVSINYDSLKEINNLLIKYNIDQSGFFDIEKWKTLGPEGIKELESYFEYITSKAEKENKQRD